jgi:hypothetical protein
MTPVSGQRDAPDVACIGLAVDVRDDCASGGPDVAAVVDKNRQVSVDMDHQLRARRVAGDVVDGLAHDCGADRS